MKQILVFFIALSLLNCVSKGTPKKDSDQEPKKERQNILFIAVDDLRPSINAYGENQMITPNIDKLASEGLQFNNAYTNIAVCGASRASIMTGIRPSQSRFRAWDSRASVDVPKAIGLNQIFKDNGYETISYGKVYHHIDDFQEGWTEHDSGYLFQDYQDPISLERISKAEMGFIGKKAPVFEYPDVSDYAYNDGKITRNAINKMKELKEEKKPFFMAVGYEAPHLPFAQPKKYWDMYDHNAIELADNVFYPENVPFIALSSQGLSNELRNGYLDIPQTGNIDDEMSRNLIHGYYASVSYLDALIGELIQGLDDLGLRESTTIVFWSDHGFFLGEHTLWCKHSTFNEAVKIPLIISSPQYAKNKTTESMTELVDIYPTLCEIAQIEAPTYLQGESLLPVLKEPSKMLKTEIYTRYGPGEAVIDNKFSYTEFYDGEKYLGNMLYDLKKDIKQNTDISKMQINADIVEKYRKKLKNMREEVNKDPFNKSLK